MYHQLFCVELAKEGNFVVVLFLLWQRHHNSEPLVDENNHLNLLGHGQWAIQQYHITSGGEVHPS